MLCWFVLVLLVKVSEAQNPLTDTDCGQVKGTISKTEGKGIEYHAYRGIPYAAPPLGWLRFQPPQPIKRWSGVLDATRDGPQCVETDLKDMKTIKGEEDCLTINVYTPKISCKNKGKLPTMVWIYGGAFIGGTSSYEKFGPDYLLDNCVCFVSFNYRVGIFGFMSTGDSEASGNNGIKDQIFALQWVQRNIEKFGGDKKNVLLFGESAGSASVSILTQVKKTEGLFHKAIMESGTSLCMWSRARQARQLAFQFGEHLKIRTNDSKVLLQGLRNKTTQELQKTFIHKLFQEIKGDPLNHLVGIGPVIEKQSNESVFTTQSYEAIQNGYCHKIPMIIGFNSNEAATMDFYPLSIILKMYGFSYKRYLERVVPINMNIKGVISKVVGGLISGKYFGKVKDSAQQFKSFMKYISHTLFIKPIITTAQLQSKYSKVFLYKFSYLSKWGSDIKRRIKGVGHNEELSYIFKRQKNFNISSCEREVRDTMCKLWTNMAHTGNPTQGPTGHKLEIKWTPVEENNVCMLNINQNSQMIDNPYSKTLTFWNDLYKKYAKQPFDTY